MDGTHDTFPIKPAPLVVPTGDEELLPGVRVNHFWSWAMGDGRLNSTRGRLAQFLVARAVGDTRLYDDGWGNFDVLSSERIRIEVKSSAYLQSWTQKRVSTIRFGGLIGHAWDETTGDYSAERQVRADVFVFCVQTATDPARYDPLDISQWAFHVVPAAAIRAGRQRSIGLPGVRRLSGGAIGWDALRDAIVMAHAGPDSAEE